MATMNKTKIFTGLLIGFALLITGCMPGYEFVQEDTVEDGSVDLSTSAQSASTGAGAAAASAPSALK